MKALASKENFAGLHNSTWLFSGAETPPYIGAVEALITYAHNRSAGPDGRERNSEVEDRLRNGLAELLHGRAKDIALLSNASEAIARLVEALELRPGDNVVVHNLEFPSGVLQLLLQQTSGAELRVVPHAGWQVSPEMMLSRVDERTRLVIVSHVSYVNGARFDYRKLYEALRGTSTLLLLDATQSLGAIPVDLRHTDFVVCSSYKWLLGVHGLGILGVNPARTAELLPKAAGWRSVSDLFSDKRFERFTFHEGARKFEVGFPGYPAIYAMEASVKLLLETGIEQIERHILQLGTRLLNGFRELGYELLSPAQDRERSGNISVACPDGEQVADELRRERRIYVWGGDGRLRASVHLFNDGEDVDKLLAALSERASLLKE